jgi:hypothetical protein
MNIAYNKRKQEYVGYTNPKNGKSIVVTAIAIDDLERKFKKAVANEKEHEDYLKNHAKALQHLADCEENETKLMIKSSQGAI